MSWQAVQMGGRNRMLLGFLFRTKKFEDGEIHLWECEHIGASDYTSLSRLYSVSSADVLCVELCRHKRWLIPTPTETGLSCDIFNGLN